MNCIHIRFSKLVSLVHRLTHTYVHSCSRDGRTCNFLLRSFTKQYNEYYIIILQLHLLFSNEIKLIFGLIKFNIY